MARKYSKKASAKVGRAMKKAQGRDPEERPFRQEGHQPQAGDRDRPFRGEGRGKEGPEEVRTKKRKTAKKRQTTKKRQG